MLTRAFAILVLLLMGGQCATACDNQAIVLVGDSVEAHDRNLCASGTLVLLRSAYAWGTVVLNNAAVISGNDASIIAGDITFVQGSVNLSRIDVKSRTVSFVSLELRNSRFIDTKVNVTGSSFTVSNVTFIGVTLIANATLSAIIDVLFDQSFMITSNFTFGTAPSIVVMRRAQMSNSTLAVIRSVCRAEQRVVFESCSVNDSSGSVVDSMTGSCDIRSSLEVAILNTNWTGGSLSVNSIFQSPASFSIVDSTVDTLGMVVMMNTVVPSGNQSRKLQVVLLRSQLTSAPLNVTAVGAVSPHLVDVSVRDSVLQLSPILARFCNIQAVVVSSWRNQYSGNQQPEALGLIVPGNCSASLSFSSAEDTLTEAKFVVTSNKEYPSVPLDSVSITGLVARGPSGSGGNVMGLVVINIYFLTLGEFSLTSSRFENGTVGSVVNAESSIIIIRNCTFAKNSVSAGALFISNPKSLSIINCTFARVDSLPTPYSKGCVTVEYQECWWRNTSSTGWHFVIMNSTFTAVDGGLNITARHYGNLELHSTEFLLANSGIDVTCTSSFGARAELLIFDRLQRAWTQKPSSLTGACESNITIKGSQFIGNRGDSLLFIDGGSQVNLANVTITNNTMSVGLVNVTGANVTAVSCRFNNNTARGPVLQARSIVLTNCTGMGNTNRDADSGGGVAQAMVIVDYGGMYTENVARGSGGTFRAVHQLQLWATIGQDSRAMKGGGFAVASDVTMSKVKFARCQTKDEGGGVVTAVNSSIFDSLIEDCSSQKGNGGAVSVNNSLVVSQSIFRRCTALEGGGGALQGLTINIDRSYFQDCAAKEGGAAQSISQFSSTVVSQSEFSRCIAHKGGALQSTRQMSIDQSRFEDCDARDAGGALQTAVYADVYLSNFSRCKSQKGGAVQGPMFIMYTLHFEHCHAREGGAIQATSEVTVLDSNFLSCSADDVGGAIMSNNIAKIDSCIFYKCNSSLAGAVRANHLESERSIVNISSSLTVGGGFYVKDLFLSNGGDVFEKNEASLGGAVWCSTAEIKEAQFMGNRASAKGGGIYVNRHANIRASMFIGNSAKDGGGAVEVNGKLEMSRVLIKDNSARSAGGVGALHVQGRNVTFDNNAAATLGGALATESFDLANTHFIGNRAAQGNVVYFSETINLGQARNISRLKQNSTVLDHNAQSIFYGEGNSTLSISFSNTVFLRNLGTLLQGSINVTFEGCLIEANDFPSHFIDCKDSSVSISNSTFQKNTGYITKGGENVSFTIRDSQFRENSNSMKTLFEIEQSSVSVSMTSFIDNPVEYLFVMRATLFNLSSVVMESNKYNMYIYTSSEGTSYNCTCRNSVKCFTVLMSQIVIRNLTASGNSNEVSCGGDVSVDEGSSLQLLSSRFTRSWAYCGGSVYGASSNIVIEDCVFEGTAVTPRGSLRPLRQVHDPYVIEPSSPGGAIFIRGDSKNSLRMTRCIVAQCSGGYGVLALVGVADVELVDVIFANNTAMYGGALAASAMTASRISIVRGAMIYNSAIFGGAMFIAFTVTVSSNSEYSGNSAFYGDIVYLRATHVLIDVSMCERGQAVPMSGGLFHVGVGIGIVISFVLLDERNERVMLGSNFTARLGDTNPSGNTRFDPSLETLNGTIYENGTVLFPNVTVTGDPGTVIDLVLKTELLRSDYNFTVKLDGCPESYGLAPYGSRGLACVLCEQGQYSYGGNSKCNECGANMVCERHNLPVSKKGYWITPVINNIVTSVECPQEKLCLGGNQCDVGYNITSYVCGRCLDGKYHWNGKCVLCRMNYFILFFAGSLVLVFVNLYAVFIQQTALPSPTASLKILLQYSQVALLVVPRIPPSASAAEVPVRFLSADMSWASLLPCFVRIEPSMFFHGSGVMSGMLIIVFMLHRVVLVKWRQKKGDSSRAITTYNSIISLLFMSVFSTTSSLFDFLSCVEVFGGHMVVTKSPSIVCSGERYRFHRALVGLYCGVAWAALALMLVKIIIDYKKAPSKTTALWTFMFYHFEDDYPQRAAYLTDWQFRRAKLRSHFCRWWQCVMLLRRVTILGTYVVVKRYKIDSALAFPLVLVGFLYLHVMINPYKSYFDNLTDGFGILLLLVASLVSRNLILCYTTVVSGSFVLAGYMLFDLISRYLSNRKAREGSHQPTIGEINGSSFSDTMSQTDGSWARNYLYTDSLPEDLGD